jgi:hypothetical protein
MDSHPISFLTRPLAPQAGSGAAPTPRRCLTCLGNTKE